MPTTHLGVTADEKVVSSFAKAFVAVNKALMDTEVLMGKVAKVEGVRTMTDAVMRGVTKTGTIVTAVLKETEKGLDIVEKRYKQVATTIEKLEGISLRRRAAPHIQAFDKVIDKERLKLPTGLTSQDKAGLDKAIEQSRKFLAQSGVTGAEIKNVWKLVRANAASSLTGVYADARDVVIKIQKEFDKLSSAPTKKLSEAAKLTALNYARTHLEAHSATLPSNISANDRLGLDAAQQNIYRLIMSSGLVGSQFDKVWNHVRSGAQTQFEGVEEVARLHLMKIVKMYDDLTKLSTKRGRADAGKTMAGYVPTVVDGVFGPKPTNLKRNEEATLDRMQQSMKALVTSGEVEFGRFNKLLDDVVKGHVTPDMNEADRKIRSFAQTIATVLASAATRANAAAKKSTDDTAKATAAKYAQGIVQSMASSKLGAMIRPDDTIALEQAQQKIAKLAGNLNVLGSGFDTVWAHVASGSKAALTGIQEDLRIAVVQMMNELARLDKLNTKRVGKQQGAVTATHVPSLIDSYRGAVGTGAKQPEIQALDRIKEKMKQLAQSAGIDTARFSAVVQDAFANKMGGTLTQSESRLRAYAQSYDAIMARIESRTKAAADKARNQNIANMKGGSAVQDMTRLFDRQTTPGGIPSMNLASGFKGELGEKVRREMMSVQSMLRRGKADWSDYEAAVKAYTTKSSANLSDAAEKIRQKLANVGQSIDALAKKSTIASQVFQKGWTFVKGQIIVDGIGRAKDKLVETTQAAADFHKQIALIQTISSDSGMTFQQWAEGIEKVANKIGRPIEEVAKAAYDALSNQITKGAETFDFLETAGKFARTSNTGLTDAANLLATQLNATGQDFSKAEEYAAKFFKVIDLGKVTGSELAHTLGRTSALVKSLGGDMDEALGIMTGLTRAGINFDESTTLVNNMMIAMINPSKELQAAFDKLGTHTGDATMKIYGTVGAFVKLREMAGSKAAFADMFPEIRRFRGADFAASNVDSIMKDVEKIKDAPKGYDLADSFTTENIGQKFIVELNKINTFWLTGFKDTVLQAVMFFNDNFLSLSDTVKLLYHSLGAATLVLGGGALILTLNKIGRAIAVMAGSEVVYTAAVARMTQATWGFVAANAALVGPVIVLGLMTANLVVKLHDMLGELDALADGARKVHAEMAAAENAATAKDIGKSKTQIIKNLEDSEKVVLRVIKDEELAVDSLMERIKEAGKETKNAVVNTMEEMLQAAKRSISDLERSLSKALATVQDTKKFRDHDNPQEFDSRKYNRERTINDINVNNRATQSSVFGNASGLPDDIYAQQFDESDNLAKARIEQLRELSKAAAAEGDWDSVKKQMSDINHLQDEIATRTQKIAIYGTNNRGERYDTGKRYDALKNPDYGKDISAEFKNQQALSKAIGDEKKRTAEIMQQQLEAQRGSLKVLEDLVKELKEFTALNKDGTIKKEFQEAGSAAAAYGKILEGIYAEANKFREGIAKSHANMDKEERDNTNTVHPKQFGQRVDASKEPTGKEASQVEQEAAAGRAKTGLHKRRSDIQSTTEMSKKKVSDDAAELVDAEKEVVAAEQELQDRTTQVTASMEYAWNGWNAGTRAWYKVVGKDAEESETKMKEFAESYKKLLGEGKYDEARKKVLEFRESAKKIDGALEEPARGSNAKEGETVDTLTNEMLNAIERHRQATLRAEEARKKFGADEAAASKAKTHTDMLKRGLDTLPESAIKFSGTIKAEFDIVDKRIKSTEGVVDALISKLDRAFARSEEFKQKTAGANEAPESAAARGKAFVSESKWMGGNVGYFSDGGAISDFMNGKMAHGRDTQPIMADPEEFIVNADSTRKFSSQLRAINSGVNPAGSGGSTTNVGDIHVNVNGGSNSSQTINEIASGLNRAIRRGTVKFKG